MCGAMNGIHRALGSSRTNAMIASSGQAAKRVNTIKGLNRADGDSGRDGGRGQLTHFQRRDNVRRSDEAVAIC